MMDFLKDIFSNKKFLIILVIIAFFICASIYVYYHYVKPKITNLPVNQEYIQNDMESSLNGPTNNSQNISGATFYFFTASWCPHSKKASPIWEELKEKYNDQIINSHKIVFETIDCEEDPGKADEFNISGYPTFKLILNNQVIEYDAKPNLETFEQFLHSTL